MCDSCEDQEPLKYVTQYLKELDLTIADARAGNPSRIYSVATRPVDPLVALQYIAQQTNNLLTRNKVLVPPTQPTKDALGVPTTVRRRSR